MDELRLLAALALVLVGGYFFYDLFASGFSFALLLAGIGCLLLGYWIKPRRDAEHDWFILFEVIDLILDIPFQALARMMRFVLRFGRDEIGLDG